MPVAPSQRKSFAAAVMLLVTMLFFGGLGALALYSSRSVEEHASASLHWPLIKGKLLKITIGNSNLVRGPTYEARLEYEYDVQNTRYQGSLISPPLRANDPTYIKNELAAFIDEKHGRTHETKNAIFYEYIHTPANAEIVVRYNPQNPAEATYVRKLQKPNMIAAKIFGWTFLGLAGLTAFLLIFISLSALKVNASPRLSKRIPTSDEIAKYVALLDEAISRAATAKNSGESSFPLEEIIVRLQGYRADASRALRDEGRLGLSRWLSGELSLELAGPACSKFIDAIYDLERFHRTFVGDQ